MKKALMSFITVLILLLLSGCDSNKDNSLVKDGTYVLEQKNTEEILLPRVTISGNEIIFSHDLLSSYLPYGTYQIEGDVLTMTTDDNNYTYTFLIDGDTLIFQKDESSTVKAINDSFSALVTDQAKFKLTVENK